MVIYNNIGHDQFYKSPEAVKPSSSSDGLQKKDMPDDDIRLKEVSSEVAASLKVDLKGWSDRTMTEEELKAAEKKQAEFEKCIVQMERPTVDLPEFSGIEKADLAIAAAVENCSETDRKFAYGIIRQNFLIDNSSSMTEEERQANISLGMKKAEYAAENFIPEEHRNAFLGAMESVAKLAAAGKADKDGKMDYGICEGSYLGHGSKMVKTDNSFILMKHIDKNAYEEYQKIGSNSSDKDSQLNAMRYLWNWHDNAIKNHVLEKYENYANTYINGTVKNQKLDTSFASINTDNKTEFLKSLGNMDTNKNGFMQKLIDQEMSSKYWK